MNKVFRVLGKKGRITIPYEMRRCVGFSAGDVISFVQMEDGRTVIVKRESVCDTDKRGLLCGDDELTLFDFLNNLSPEQQRAALVHLSVKWAEKQGETEGGRRC